jgi:hypothetical protein
MGAEKGSGQAARSVSASGICLVLPFLAAWRSSEKQA